MSKKQEEPKEQEPLEKIPHLIDPVEIFLFIEETLGKKPEEPKEQEPPEVVEPE